MAIDSPGGPLGLSGSAGIPPGSTGYSIRTWNLDQMRPASIARFTRKEKAGAGAIVRMAHSASARAVAKSRTQRGNLGFTGTVRSFEPLVFRWGIAGSGSLVTQGGGAFYAPPYRGTRIKSSCPDYIARLRWFRSATSGGRRSVVSRDVPYRLPSSFPSLGTPPPYPPQGVSRSRAPLQRFRCLANLGENPSSPRTENSKKTLEIQLDRDDYYGHEYRSR